MGSFDGDLRKDLQKNIRSGSEKKTVGTTKKSTFTRDTSTASASPFQKTLQKDEAFERLQSAYSALDQSSRQRYAGLVQQALGSSAQSYASDYSALQDLFSRESSRTGYRSADDARLFNQRASEQAQSLSSRAERYQKMLDLFGSDMDEDFRTSFSDMLSGTGAGVSQMRKYASDTQDFFSQFADEDEYNAYQDMMSHYNAAKNAGKTTMQWYDEALAARDEADTRFNEAQRRLTDFENQSSELVFDPETGAFLGTRADLGEDYSSRISSAKEERDAAAKEKAERARDLYYADMFRYQDWQINDEDVLAGKEKMEVADAANQAISEMGRSIDYSNYAQTAGDLSYAEPLADQYKRDWSYKQPTDKWEQKDLDLYYSLFNSDPALADEYAIKINNQINSQAYAEKVKPVQEWMVREEGKWGRNIATGGAALAAGVATAPEDFFDYLDMMAQLAGRGVVMQKADPILADYADEMVSTRAKDLNDFGTIQSGWFEGKGLGDLYQLSESVLESITLGNLAGPLGTSAVFFGSAAKDALKSSLDSGASPKQAMIYSVVSGLNEAAWEYFSVDKMLSMKSPKNLAQFFGGLLTQGFVEGSEEFNTSLANSVAQAMILKDKSDIELNIQRYISEGMSYDEARKKAMQDWGKSLAADFAGGMISGMASGGVQQIGSSARDAVTAVDDQSARDIIEYGREAGDPKAKALAEKYQKRIEQLDRKGNPGKLSVAQYNKLDRTATQSYVQGDIAAVEAKLKERGIESPALARAIATEALRQEAERVGAEAPKLTREQKQLLNGNHMAEQILNDLDVGNLRNEASGGGFTYRDNSWVKEMKPTKLLAADVYGSQAATSTISESEKNGVTLDGQKVRIVGAQDGKVTVEKNGQRQTVELDELQGLSDGYRQLIEAAGETKSAEPMLRLYQPGQDVGRYISAWNYAENVFGAQTTNTTLEEVRQSPLVKELDDVQLKYAFEMGRERAQQRAQEVKAKAEERKAAREEAKKRGAEKRRKGTVSVDGAEINGKKYKGVNEKKLTTSQKKVVAMVRALADAVNIDYVVYDGNPDEGGTYVKGGTVLININSGQLSTKNLGAATVSHELTHYLQDFAPEEYEQLKGFITQHIMKKSPAQFDALVRQQQKLDPKLSYDKAVDELVANACQKMLLNSRAVTQLARQNMTLAEKIQDAIADISEKIKAAFEGVDLKDDIAVYRAAREISDVMDQVQELWDKALLAADASYNAVEQTGMKSASDTSGEMQSMSWDAKEFGREVQKWYDTTTAQERLKSPGIFRVGTTSDPLKSIGVKDGKLIWGKSKMEKILQDHAGEGIDLDVIKQVPDIAERPVFVLKSKTVDGSIVLFGTVETKTHRKMLATISLKPAPRGDLSVDFTVITGAYSRRNNQIKNMLTSSEILYVDGSNENGRTNAWLKQLGLQLPSRTPNIGPVGTISYAGKDVNISGKTWEQLYGKAETESEQHLDEEQHQRWGMAETDEEREARRESVANLKAENRILRARAEYWKGQTQQTRERTVRQQDTDRLANDLLREYESRADKDEVKAALKELGDWLVQSDGDTLSYDELRERARAIAEDIVDGNYALIDDSQSEMLGRLKDYLKSTPVNLSSADWRDTGDEHFRRRYGRYFTVSERGRTIDSLWGELSATFGESLFPEDTYAPGDMLNMIGDYLDLWKPQYGNVFEQYRGEAVDAAANEIIDAMLGEEVRQSAATYADRAQQRLNAQIAKDKDRLDALREQKNARIEEIKREAAEKVRQVRLSEKAMKYEAVDKVKQHYRDMMQRQRGKRSDTALRGKIKKLHRELSDMLVKPGEKRYVPRELVKATAEILNSIDTTSGRAVKAKAALAELRVQYEAMAKDDHYALTYDETVSGMLQELAENIGDGSIYDLRGSELESVYNVLRALKTTIQNANRLVGAEIEATAFEAGNLMMTEATNAKSVPTVLLRKFVFGQATPETAFSLFGGYKKNSMWRQMYDMLNRGQLTQTQIMMEGGAIFRELIDDKQMKTLHDRKNLVDIGMKDAEGNAILVTRGMMLSVYMHLQNEQNTRHIAYGGLTVPRLREYYNSKMKEAFTGKTGHAVAFFEEIQEVNRQLAEAETQEEKDALSERLAELQDETNAYIDGMRSKIEEQLTEYDRKWIEAAQEFFDVYSKGKLNEVTEMVYGFQKAQVERYFPIHTDPDYRTANFDTITRDMSLENAGFMKERVTASNPILLEDITDVISSQLRRTAQYCGLMPVIRNFNKAYGKSRTGYTMTVQKAVGETFGVEGKKYIENLIADLNGARKTEANIFDALRGNMAGAALTVNLRVTLSQTASWPTAAAEIGYRPLTKALVDMKNPMWDKGLREEIAKWTPLYWYRMQGYSTAELGDIKSNEQLMNRIMQKTKWLTGWIQFADGLTTGGLWQASKYYVDENFSDLRRGSDEYMMKVAEVYNRVIERTQPDYTTMQRPDILRNPHAVVKQLTMFMTQRLQNTNLLFSSAAEYMKYSHDLKAGINGVTAEDVSVARTRFLWAGTSQLIASGMIVLFKAAADAIMHSMNAYRDDDDELTKESVVHTLLVNFAETLTSNFLGGAELFTLLKSAATGERYYGISLNGVDTINTTLTETLNTYKKLKDKNADAEAKWKQVGKLAKAAGQFIGAPVGNLMKWAEMIMNHAEDIRNGEFGSFEAGVDRTRTQNTRLLYEALQAGDTKKAEKLKEEIGDEKAVRSALKTYIKQIYTEDKQIMKAEVVSLLQRYCGMTRKNAENTAQQWTMQVVTGMSYDKLGDEYISGNVPRNTASRYLQTYGGKTQAEAEEKLNEWQCEKDTGIAYSDIANEVKIGNISPERAVDMLVKYGGKDPDAAEKTVEGYMIEHEYGFSPSDLQDEYLAGNVSDADAFDILMSYKYFGKEDAEEKSADELERLQFVRANPGTEEISITQARNYQSSGLSGYISPVDYMQAAKMMGTFHGVDADGNGKSDPYSKVTQQLAYIDTLKLTPEQKSRLAQALGINEKTIRKKAPWLK